MKLIGNLLSQIPIYVAALTLLIVISIVLYEIGQWIEYRRSKGKRNNMISKNDIVDIIVLILFVVGCVCYFPVRYLEKPFGLIFLLFFWSLSLFIDAKFKKNEKFNSELGEKEKTAMNGIGKS